MWNSIDDTYSNFAFYIETKPHFLIFVSLESIICMIVWNTIDDKFFIIPLYRNETTFLDFAFFESIFSMTVWNNIDDGYSIFSLYRNEATFHAFAPFSEHFQYDSVEYYR